MSQISKHIPIQDHKGFPSILLLQNYAMLEGNAFVLAKRTTVQDQASQRMFWETDSGVPFMFCVTLQAVYINAPTATTDVFIREFASPVAPSVFSGFPRNMNRLFSNSSIIDVGSCTGENIPTEVIYESNLLEGNVNNSRWFMADPEKTYGFEVKNNESSNHIQLNYRVYFIEGVR